VRNPRADIARELRIANAARHGAASGCRARQPLGYRNVAPIAAIPEIVELNISHAIVARRCSATAKAVRG
jgi:pyridoxine 5-phosphate synthase